MRWNSQRFKTELSIYSDLCFRFGNLIDASDKIVELKKTMIFSKMLSILYIYIYIYTYIYIIMD